MYWAYVCCQRLNLQHYLWKQQQGYLIHPNILSIKQENLKIADIGTGTAIFLLDLADSLPPSTQLHGFDIDLTQCPPKPWLPANVNLRTLDVYDEPSEDLSEQYDIIHIRFFLCVIKNNDPTLILQKMLRMLKPGGWIQWVEQDLTTCWIETAFPNLDTQRTEVLKDFALAPIPQWPSNHGSWVAALKQFFEEEGLQDVVEDRRKKKSHHLSNSQDVTLLAMEEMSTKLSKGSTLREMIQKAAQEFEVNQRGIAIASDRVTVIGRKP
ncbi:MAG: hypothetical protein MMC33_005322 [Icmadophila ericetorum]|nr:hypothetical protein [Icmadophila ericetorum]